MTVNLVKGQVLTAAQWNALFNTISGSTIDGSVIGGTTPAAGTFTTLGAAATTLTGLLTINTGLAGAAFLTAGLGTAGWLSADANNGAVTWAAGTNSGPGVSVISGAGNMAGTGGAGKTPAMFQLSVSSDTLNSTATSNGAFGLVLNHNFGGAGYAGSHAGMLINFVQTGTISNGGGYFYDGLNVWLTGSAAVSGTAAGMIAFNPQINLTAGATGFGLAELIEGTINSQVAVGVRAGITMFSGGSFQGTTDDYAYGIVGDRTASARYKMGIAFGKSIDGWPLNSSSTMIGTLPQTSNTGVQKQVAARGIDFSKVGFTTAALWSPGLKVDGDGTTHIGVGNLNPVATGLNIDSEGYQGNTPTVSNGGTGYAVNDNLYDTNGGILVVDTINGSGTVLTWHYDKPPYSYGGAGPATMALAGGTGNQAAVVGVTWTKGTYVRLQSPGGQTLVGGYLGVTGVVDTVAVYSVSSTQVVGARSTGWTAMTGTANKNTSYDTSTVTLAQLAGRVMSLQAALTTHGLIGA